MSCKSVNIITKMPLSHTARVHLFYQSIILTIVFWSFGYNAILPDRKTLYAIFVPIVVYQLLILLCWIELMPVPGWMDSNNDENKTIDETSNPVNGTWSKSDDELKNNKTSSLIRSRSFGSRTYKFRNWKSNWQDDIYNSSETRDNAAALKLNRWNYGNVISGKSDSTTKQYINSWTYPDSKNEFQESDLTKRYFFPYRQKRREQWIDNECSDRPYKIRNWISEIEKSDIGRQANSNCTNESENKTDHTDDTDSNDEAGLNKSYSFPFRQKRSEQWFEKIGNTPRHQYNAKPMQYWKSVEYTVAQKEIQKRQQSAPGVKPTDKTATESETDRDFSQSVEVTSSLDKDRSCSRSLISMSASSLRSKRILSQSSSNSIQKLTRGVANYFSKNKKENEDNDTKSITKKRSFRSIFRDSRKSPLHTNSECVDNMKLDNNDEDKTYISYHRESFEDDIHKRMVELGRI